MKDTDISHLVSIPQLIDTAETTTFALCTIQVPCFKNNRRNGIILSRNTLKYIDVLNILTGLLIHVITVYFFIIIIIIFHHRGQSMQEGQC